jgi:hypothetical protein
MRNVSNEHAPKRLSLGPPRRATVWGGQGEGRASQGGHYVQAEGPPWQRITLRLDLSSGNKKLPG